MKKEWTVVNGVIGTHHQNRKGEYVDFRPASSPLCCLGCNGAWWSKKDAENYGFGISPPRGQAIEPLRLVPIRVEEKEIRNDDGTYARYQTYFFQFQGSKMSLTTKRPEEGWWDENARQESIRRWEKRQKDADKKRAERREQFRRDEERKKVFLDSVSENIFLSHPWSQAEISKMDGGHLSEGAVIQEVIENIYFQEFPGERRLDVRIALKATEKFNGIMSKIISAEKIKKEEKKKAWLARQRKG